MIQAVMHKTIVEVEIFSSSISQFSEEMTRFKEAIAAADREFDPARKTWIVRNPEKYAHVPFIKGALDDRQRQMSLFEDL